MINILFNTMVEPIKMTCEDCKSEFTYNYEDIKTESGLDMLFSNPYYARYILCPVCKHRNILKTVRLDVEEENNNDGL